MAERKLLLEANVEVANSLVEKEKQYMEANHKKQEKANREFIGLSKIPERPHCK